MKILFLGTSGVHHSLVAANLFLDRIKNPDFRFIRGFCDTHHDESGFPIYVDEDQDGNQVYSLGVGPQVEVGRRSIEDLTRILGGGPQELLIKPVSVRGDKFIYYLGKIPKVLGGGFLNMSISTYLIKRDFEKVKEDVKSLREQVYPA